MTTTGGTGARPTRSEVRRRVMPPTWRRYSATGPHRLSRRSRALTGPTWVLAKYVRSEPLGFFNYDRVWSYTSVTPCLEECGCTRVLPPPDWSYRGVT
ncbi:hypothetical protein CCFV1_ORF031 [Cotesia congregata filamentous virus 1]|uniref:Uncharacterized protein n=1 Tax=Cotesia congregata filamentous virus 1 TaxID=3064291 RepID=A0ABC8QJK9_9VIRU|nr:hypothetical protein CCFV1_ORF031 [Cotesia congregata filamentous virus 1]